MTFPKHAEIPGFGQSHRILDWNARAERLLAAGTVLQLREGKLTAHAPEGARRLAAALHRDLRTGSAAREAGFCAGEGLTPHVRDHGECLHVLVTPIRRASPHALGAAGIRAAVIVPEPSPASTRRSRCCTNGTA